MNPKLITLEKYAVKYFLTLLGSTLKYRERNPSPDFRCIYLFWHRNILPLMYLHRERNIAIIVSPSNDGELIAAPAEIMGYKTIRGSSSRQGISALLKSLALEERQSLAITPDGPKGPRERVKKSALFISYHTGLPIVPIAVNLDREWLFPTWDVFRIPKPKCVVDVSYGEPIYVRKREEVDTKLAFLQLSMDQLHYDNRLKYKR